MIICAKCGAEIEDNQPKCEYCGWMNYNAAEEEYFEKLEAIREQIKELETEPETVFKSDIKHIIKDVIIAIIVTSIFIVILDKIIIML